MPISKFCFAEKQVEYLGHIILGERVQADHEKIEDMKNWPIPRSVKQLRGFLGLTGFYRRFVKDYGVISEPLMALLKKDGFKWNEEVEKAFNKMKETMSESPVLAIADFTKVFVVEADACDGGIGVVIMKEGKPIACFSIAFGDKSKHLSTYEKS